jgi:membrane fusion protein, multidrug efflux system
MRVSITTAMLAVLMLAACGQEQAKQTAAEEEPAQAIPVEVALANRADIYSTYTGTAAIEALREATVIAKVGGEIREILVEEGDDVRAGQLLARLDGDRLRLTRAQAEANLQKLQRDYQRNLDLKERSLISAGDFEKIQYEMEALEASFKLASLELSYTEIRAPIDGVISRRLIKTGNTIDVNSALFEIVSLDPLVTYLHVPEREYRRMSPGMPANLQIDALGGARFDASIARISPVVDPATGTFKITVEVSDASRRLKPGMFARIGIVSDMHAAALQIPRSAIISDADEAAVFVVDGETASRRTVRTGFTANGNVEIVDGLEGHEQIVIVGQAGLRDGSRVQIINADDQANALAATESGSGERS